MSIDPWLEVRSDVTTRVRGCLESEDLRGARLQVFFWFFLSCRVVCVSCACVVCVVGGKFLLVVGISAVQVPRIAAGLASFFFVQEDRIRSFFS